MTNTSVNFSFDKLKLLTRINEYEARTGKEACLYMSKNTSRLINNYKNKDGSCYSALIGMYGRRVAYDDALDIGVIDIRSIGEESKTPLMDIIVESLEEERSDFINYIKKHIKEMEREIEK